MKKTAKFAAVMLMALALVMPLSAGSGISPDTVVESFLTYLQTEEMDDLAPIIGVTPDMFTDDEREVMIDTLWQSLDYAGAWVNDMVMDDEQIFLDFELGAPMSIKIDADGLITFRYRDYPMSMVTTIGIDERGNVCFSKQEKNDDYWSQYDNTFVYYLSVNEIEEGEIVEQFEGYDTDKHENGYECYHYTTDSPAGLSVMHGFDGNGRDYDYWVGEKDGGIATLVGKDGYYGNDSLLKVWLLEEGDEWEPEWFIRHDCYPVWTNLSLHHFTYGDPAEWTNRGAVLEYKEDKIWNYFYVDATVEEVEEDLGEFYPYFDFYRNDDGDPVYWYEDGEGFSIEFYERWDGITRIELNFEGLRSYDAMKLRKSIVLPI